MRSLIKSDSKINANDVFEVVKVEADYLPTLLIKNRTLKKILDTLTEEHLLEQQWEDNKQEMMILSGFEEADKKLEYFNHKALILSVID